MPCDSKTEVYSRVVGYYRPVQQWNKAKQAEYADRIPYNLTNPTKPLAEQTSDKRTTMQAMCCVWRMKREREKD